MLRQSNHFFFLVLLCIFVLAVGSGSVSAEPAAITFLITKSSGEMGGDRIPGDGICEDFFGGGCSWIAAITETNGLNGSMGTVTIRFALDGIYVGQPYGQGGFRERVIIDGRTKHNGALAGSCASSSTNVEGGATLTASGSGNSGIGWIVFEDGSDGSSIYGMDVGGIEIKNGADNINVYCNRIGAGELLSGMLVESDNNTVGGNSISERNYIKSGQHPLLFKGSSSGNTVLNNWIGVDAGTSGQVLSAAGSFAGIYLQGSDDNIIGEPGRGNIIAFIDEELGRFGHGVMVGSTADGNTIRGNSIYGNDGLGIRLDEPQAGLANDEQSPNDTLDGDTGANGLQNYPVITTAFTNGVVEGRLKSKSNSTYTIDIYRDIPTSQSPCAGGQYIGTHTVSTDFGGRINFTFNLGPQTTGKMTMTATDSDGNTSEFSPCTEIVDVEFIVNSSADLSNGVNSTNGQCDVQINNETKCTLREALNEANSPALTALATTIRFDLPTNDRTILLSSGLPTVGDTVHISGTESGVCLSDELGEQLVTIDGSNAGANEKGFSFSGQSSGSSLHGLAIVNFDGDGVGLGSTVAVTCNEIGLAGGNGESGIRVTGDDNVISQNVISNNTDAGIEFLFDPDNTVIASNYIGTTLDGNDPAGNDIGIWIRDAGGVSMDGTSIQFNTISGSTNAGIDIDGPGSFAVVGNRIGTTQASGGSIPNGAYGIQVHDGTVTIGVDTLDGGRTYNPNFVGNNAVGGILVDGGSAEIVGNYIGTTASSNTPTGNTGRGIIVTAPNVIIGGTAAADRNVIVNNTSDGILINNTSNATIVGNYIGVNPDGSTPRGNGGHGIWLLNGFGHTIGNDLATAPNIISSNSGHGIYANQGVNNMTIAGNVIGLDASGQVDLGNTLNGIESTSGNNNIYGGINDAARNIISGNDFFGLELINETNALVFGNYIGSDTAGKVGIANTGNGVHISNGSNVTVGSSAAPNIIIDNGGEGIYATGINNLQIRDNLIGVNIENAAVGNGFNGVHLGNNVTSSDVRSNTIAHNGHATSNNTAGVTVSSGASGNDILANFIYKNVGFGIDLGGNGITPNDESLLDADTGANGLQNFPEITDADVDSGLIKFTLDSKKSRTFQIELFASRSCDGASGSHGEGERYLGSTTAVTDESGIASASFTASGLFAQGESITATATDGSGDGTSEFSACVQATGSTTPTAIALSAQPSAVSYHAVSAMYGLMALLLMSAVGLGFGRKFPIKSGG